MINFILLTILCSTYGLFFPIGKLIIETHAIITPLYLIGIRFAIAGLMCMAYVAFYQKKWTMFTTKHILPILIVSLLSIHATNALELWALQHMDAGKTCFIYSCAPIISAILGYIVYQERLTGIQIIALIVGTLGFLPVILDGTNTESTMFWSFSYPELAIFASAILTITGWMFVKKLNQNMSFLQVNGTSMFVGGLTALVHAMGTETSTFVIQWHDHAGMIVMSIAGLLILSNLISYNLHAFLLTRMSVTMINFACLSCTFFAALFSFLIIGEPMRFSLVQSMFIVIPALSIYFLEQMKPGYLATQWKQCRTKKTAKV